MNLFIATTSHSVSAGVTAVFAIILVCLILCLALEEKIHAKKSLIAGAFAVFCLLLGAICDILPFDHVAIGSHRAKEHDGFHGEIEFDADHHIESVDIEKQESDEEPQPEHASPIDAEHQPAHGDTESHGDTQSHDEVLIHVDGHRISMPVYIPGIDWGVIAIILGSSLFVDVTSKSGLFTWIAIKVTKASRGDPLFLLCSYGLMTVAFSAVLNNVTAMIIVGSLTAVSLEKLGRQDKLLGFLLIEGLLTNVGGLLTLISSVPNIIVGTAAEISFVEFFLKSSPYVAIATLLTILMGAKFFKIHSLTGSTEKQEAADLVDGFDENDGVESWSFFRFAAGMLVLFVILIATTSVLPARIHHLGMGFIAISFAVVMLMRYKSEVDQFYRAVDWDLLGFFAALFVVIYVMEHAQVLDAIGTGLQQITRELDAERAHYGDASVLLVGAAAFSSVTDNIPLAAMLANILKEIGAPPSSGLWWAVIFGANLGGNLTPIGSASTLVAVTIMHKHKLHVSFVKFVKMAIPFAAIHILLAVIYVLMFLR